MDIVISMTDMTCREKIGRLAEEQTERLAKGCPKTFELMRNGGFDQIMIETPIGNCDLLIDENYSRDGMWVYNGCLCGKTLEIAIGFLSRPIKNRVFVPFSSKPTAEIQDGSVAAFYDREKLGFELLGDMPFMMLKQQLSKVISKMIGAAEATSLPTTYDDNTRSAEEGHERNKFKEERPAEVIKSSIRRTKKEMHDTTGITLPERYKIDLYNVGEVVLKHILIDYSGDVYEDEDEDGRPILVEGLMHKYRGFFEYKDEDFVVNAYLKPLSNTGFGGILENGGRFGFGMIKADCGTSYKETLSEIEKAWEKKLKEYYPKDRDPK